MSSQKDVILEARHLTKSFGLYRTNRHDVIKGIDLKIYSGEFVCIMGPSGSGKTTLLNLLSTIDAPTTGAVIINNTSVGKLGLIGLADFRHEHLGFIFQDFYLNERLSVFKNIATPLLVNNVDKEEIRHRVQDVAYLLHIEDQLDKMVDQCSRGQKQRIAVARALVTNPKLIVADEPTGNLDQKNAHELLKILQKLNKRLNLTILLVTHDLLVASYSSRFFYLKDGQITTEFERGELSQLDYLHRIRDCFEDGES